MRMAFNEVLEKREASTDFLRETLSSLLRKLMEHEVNGRCGAEKHARSDERIIQRNGYRDRLLETRNADKSSEWLTGCGVCCGQ